MISNQEVESRVSLLGTVAKHNVVLELLLHQALHQMRVIGTKAIILSLNQDKGTPRDWKVQGPREVSSFLLVLK